MYSLSVLTLKAGYGHGKGMDFPLINLSKNYTASKLSKTVSLNVKHYNVSIMANIKLKVWNIA